MSSLLPSLQSPLYLITKLLGHDPVTNRATSFRANGMQGDWLFAPVRGAANGDRLLMSWLSGGFAPLPVFSRTVSMDRINLIEYAIIAFDGKEIIRQDYRHDFKRHSLARIDNGFLHAQWETQPLDFLLKSKRIAPHARGIQFVS